MIFLRFWLVISKLLIHIVLLPFYTWLCKVYWCCFGCLHMLYCFCFFCSRQQGQYCMSQSYSISNIISETLSSLETIVLHRAVIFIRGTEFNCYDDSGMQTNDWSNWCQSLKSKLSPVMASVSNIFLMWCLHFYYVLNVVHVYTDIIMKQFLLLDAHLLDILHLDPITQWISSNCIFSGHCRRTSEMSCGLSEYVKNTNHVTSVPVIG